MLENIDMTQTTEKTPIALNLVCSLFLAGSFYIVMSCGGDIEDTTPAEEEMAMTEMMSLDVGFAEDAGAPDSDIEIDMEFLDSGTDAALNIADSGVVSTSVKAI